MPIEIRMPRLTDAMTEGTVVTWYKQPGASVRRGESLAELEADKSMVDLLAPADGVLERIVAGLPGAPVPVGTVIAILAPSQELVIEGGRTSQNLAVESSRFPGSAPAPQLSSDRVQTAESITRPAAATGSIAAAMTPEPAGKHDMTPLAFEIASQAELDLSALHANHPTGRILAREVLERLAAGSGQTTGRAPGLIGHAPGEFPAGSSSIPIPCEDRPLNATRKLSARRLRESKQEIPHYYLTIDCEIDRLLSLRTELASSQAGAIHYSLNDFLVRAAVLALRAVPEANAAWTETAIRVYGPVHLAIAVATPGGLRAPVVRNAETMRFSQLVESVRDRIARARTGRLEPADYQNGTFTISNLGMYGVDSFAAIINPPQAAILACGRARRRPVVQGDSIVPATVMQCTLSADHRVIDGADGARFLSCFQRLLEHPIALLA
jgi:pyruvate dehydrogenase E2 component (dihydrolipoamide acetyltransferase)